MRTYERYASSTRAVVLGKLLCNRWIAASRQKLWWMVPSWGSTCDEIPEETQFLLLRMSHEDNSRFFLLFPVQGVSTCPASSVCCSGEASYPLLSRI